MRTRMLVLDFDGVICDALTECALVTWLGRLPASHQAPVSSYLPALPREFVRRFQQVRDYSRVLEHFVVAHRPAAARVRSQADFDTLFATISTGLVARFSAAATAARQRCRRQEREFWLDLHTLYAGIPDLLRRHAGMVHVVTAKDAESVRTILDRHRLGPTVREVVGECAAKAEAVRDLSVRHGVPPAGVLFVDDNLTNVRRVAATGVPARWATWGYHTPEDLAGAGPAGIDRLDLAAVPALDLTSART